ncbi:SapC family protein [Xanthomonas floridensis]|uniref:Peptide ABC transporter permease n=1 Tax=Xanthomonas floridensis TaxID=1843580 RepID=A0A1A9MH45_9XANT|nr:SapC family protein [Xanthomonas floridensis]MEA5123515.1 SapC family protein [Xanthomonas floridensis]MEA5130381.1 SapC family protein [Xanthomonas floridensis]OAG69379.1 peptide ABC transporter permease [Xanthomonas floridensis]
MTRYAVLNNVAHHDVRVVLRFGAEFGDAVGLVPAFVTEYADLQREYPLFFRKDPATGGYQSVALLGFAQDENLFLHDGRWSANYLPGVVAKGPFLIGFQEQRIDGALVQEPVIHIDLEHPRVSRSEGEPVFLPQGGHSPYLEHIIGVLRGIREGMDAGQAMAAAFDALGLIQPVRLDVALDATHAAHLDGLFAIDRERLARLDAQPLQQLHQAGYLEGAFLMLASLHNVRRLMAEKQRRLQHARTAPAAAHA